ncbi:hypothetical protein pb186bvf_005508 [Paramecium bursaria]
MNYGNIDGESALVTSQYHITDSPKAIIDFSQSERLETKTNESKLKSKSMDSEGFLEIQQLELNSQQLPQLSTQCHSNAVFDHIVQELKSFKCVHRDKKQMLLMHIQHRPICQKIQQKICQDTYIASKSHNQIIQITFHSGKILVNALSGNYKKNEDSVIQISQCIKRFNHLNRTSNYYEDKMVYPNLRMTFQISQVYQYIQDNHQYQLRINGIKQNIESITKPTKQVLQKIVYECGQLVYDMLQFFKENNKKSTHQTFQLQIEKFIFTEIQNIQNLYQTLTQNNEMGLYNNHLKIGVEIKQKYQDYDIKKFLDIKPKFQDSNYLPGIQELEKLSIFLNPRDKLRSLQMMHSHVKAAVYEGSGEELATMDDELPVMIYITLKSELQNSYAQIAFVDDFCNTDPTIETEKRILTNIKGSLDYILKDWTY